MCIARLRRQTRDKYWKKPLKPVRCKKNIVPLQRARASRRDSTQKRRGRCPATAGMDRAEAGRRVQSAGCPDHASRAGRSRPDLLQLPQNASTCPPRSPCTHESDQNGQTDQKSRSTHQTGSRAAKQMGTATAERGGARNTRKSAPPLTR